MGTEASGAPVAGEVNLASTVYGTMVEADGADAVTLPPGVGSSGEAMDSEIEPFGSAICCHTGPVGKDAETVSPGTNPTAVSSVASPAASWAGTMETLGITVAGPGPTRPEVSPT